ncbi:hypothetical protein BN1200_770011 [Klebsiella variicola]|nr:hypothetical protein BN1200_770011 [Klebsiella variicola]
MNNRVGYFYFKIITTRLSMKHCVPERLRTRNLMTKKHHEFNYVLFIMKYIKPFICERF